MGQGFSFRKKYGIEDIKMLDPKSFNMCRLDYYMKGFETKYMKSDSISDTFQVISKIRSSDVVPMVKNFSNMPVFLKVSSYMKYTKEGNVTQEMLETFAYKYLTLLQEAKVFNCFPKYYSDFSCFYRIPQVDQTSLEKLSGKTVEKVQEYYNQIADHQRNIRRMMNGESIRGMTVESEQTSIEQISIEIDNYIKSVNTNFLRTVEEKMLEGFDLSRKNAFVSFSEKLLLQNDIIAKEYGENYVVRNRWPMQETRYHVLMTELLGEDCRPMKDMLESGLFLNDMEGNEAESILFQLEYATSELIEAGLIHNDLHDGNVYIRRFKDPKKIAYFYRYRDTIYKIEFETKYQVIIIDFDNVGIVESVYKKYKSELANTDNGPFCLEYGMCEHINYVFDMNTILMYMWKNYISHGKNIRGRFKYYMEAKYPRVNNGNYSDYLNGRFAQGYEARLCIKNSNGKCNNWYEDYVRMPDGPLIRPFSTLLYDDIYRWETSRKTNMVEQPNDDRMIFRSAKIEIYGTIGDFHQSVETFINQNPETITSISLVLRNPFKEESVSLLNDIMYSVQKDANYVGN